MSGLVICSHKQWHFHMPNNLMHDLNIMILNSSFVDNKVFLIAMHFLLGFFWKKFAWQNKLLYQFTCENSRIQILHMFWVFSSLRSSMDALNLFSLCFYYYCVFFSLNPSLSPKKLILLKMIIKGQSRDAQHQRVQQNLHLRFHPDRHLLGYLHRNLML